MTQTMTKKTQLTPFCIQTGEGFYDFEEPGRSTVTIEEIAHSLNGIRRWNGQTTTYISVAQHACLVSDWLLAKAEPDNEPDQYDGYLVAYYGLHHDDHEALRGDIPSPRKRYLKKHKMLFEGEEEVEDTFIYGKLLGVKYPVPEWIEKRVKEADLVSLITEKKWLKPDTVIWDPNSPKVDGIEPLSEEDLFSYLDTLSNWEDEFLTRHYNLKELINA